MAHIWTGDDTVCRMASTGGIKEGNFEVVDDIADRKVCRMCDHMNKNPVKPKAVEDTAPRTKVTGIKCRACSHVNDTPFACALRFEDLGRVRCKNCNAKEPTMEILCY